MLKKISIEALRPGMVIHSHVGLWHNDPSLPEPFPITSKKDITMLEERGIQDVYIDTMEGDDAPEARSQDEVTEELNAQLRELVGAKSDPLAEEVTAITADLQEASAITDQANQLVGNMLNDARLGKMVDARAFTKVAEDMVTIIRRNMDAMIVMALLRCTDEETLSHSVNVGIFLAAFCTHLGLDPRISEQAGVAGFLHDVGKVRVPRGILEKEGTLTDKEYMEAKQHVNFGKELLENSKGITKVMHIILSQHHERYDGTGYPKRLYQNQIHRLGQMAGIADVYDAITSKRSFRAPLESHVALRKMLEWGERQFNQELFQHFVRCLGIYPAGSMVELKNGMIGLILRNHREDLLRPLIKVVKDTQSWSGPPRYIDLRSMRNQPEYEIVDHASQHGSGIDPLHHLNIP
ncbi:MAG: DUF3391 domain-containing protein [Magnetococcales bacterium]|nr:DUF3391 domain-containing protein [Magnetococcales bacterium]